MASSNHRAAGSSTGVLQIGSAWFQRKINLRPQHRGVHLVTEEILRQMPELAQFSVGLCHVQSKFFFLYYSTFFSNYSYSFNSVFQLFLPSCCCRCCIFISLSFRSFLWNGSLRLTFAFPRLLYNFL